VLVPDPCSLVGAIAVAMALAQSERATEDERHALQQHAARYATPEALTVHVQACICVATHDKPNIVRTEITIWPLLTRDPPIGTNRETCTNLSAEENDAPRLTGMLSCRSWPSQRPGTPSATASPSAAAAPNPARRTLPALSSFFCASSWRTSPCEC